MIFRIFYSLMAAFMFWCALTQEEDRAWSIIIGSMAVLCVIGSLVTDFLGKKKT